MATGSTLIYGSSAKRRLEKIEELIRELDETLLGPGHPDLLRIGLDKGKKRIGIGQVRKMITFLATKPYSSLHKIVVIEAGDYLTTQAQNALLKTLEEPPEYAFLMIGAKSELSLLPTIVSRCKKVRATVEEVEIEAGELTAGEVLGIGLGDRLTLAQKVAKQDREEVVELLEAWIREERAKMVASGNVEKAENLVALGTILEDLEKTNVNLRLALETLFLKLK